MKPARFRLVSMLTAFLAVAGACAQIQIRGKTYGLTPAIVVAGPIEQVIWSPGGTDLAYISQGETGTRIGIFNIKHNAGAFVATLGDTEQLDDLVWLNGGHKALLTTHRKAEADRLIIRVLDGEQLKATELWSAEYPAASNATLRIIPSPSLTHAVVAIDHIGQYLVVTDNAKAVVSSPEIAQALQGGRVMVWSSRGTAIFGMPDSTEVTSTVASRLKEGTIFEAVPSNGTLRSVRFPGIFEYAARTPQILQPAYQQVEHRMGRTTASVQSLWMIPLVDGKEPQDGIFVSAQVEGVWMAPTGRAVAYTCHKALFVQQIFSKK